MKQTIVVTGASSGIGLFIATKLHHSGYQVIGTSRNPEKYQSRIPFKLLSLDITNLQSIENFVVSFFTEIKAIDVLINNAGNMLSGLVEETSIKEAQQQFETNFWGAVCFTKALLPYLREQRHGKIITFSSLLGLMGMPGAAYYSATKHALEGFFKSLHFELKQFDIKVSVVEPSFFKTNIDKNAIESLEKLTTTIYSDSK